MQQGLEDLYRVEAGAEISSFLVDRRVRDELVGNSEVPEQLLVLDDAPDEVSLALYLDAAIMERLEGSRHAPDEDLSAYLLALEGVSHFVYAAHCARAGRQVSQLELELQAEVDKYAVCLLRTPLASAQGSAGLRARLFRGFELEPALGPDEIERYLAANDNAAKYSQRLERRYVAHGALEGLVGELRRFYRGSLSQKLGRIANVG